VMDRGRRWMQTPQGVDPLRSESPSYRTELLKRRTP